jgi:hypothetical protein
VKGKKKNRNCLFKVIFVVEGLTELMELTEITELTELMELTELTVLTELMELTELMALTELTELKGKLNRAASLRT